MLVNLIFYASIDYVLADNTQALAEYSERELKILENLKEEIEDQYEDVTVISVNRIQSASIRFKFDTPPIISHSRTLVPVRAFSESLEANVVWKPSTQEVIIKKDSIYIKITINDKKVMVNDTEKKIDVPARIFNDRTYIPLRFVIETFGLDIEYESKTGMITIENKGVDFER